MKLIPILLAAAMTANAAPNDPGTVAVDFLEKIRLGKIDLEPGGDTALSAQTSVGKKSQIARNFERMARDLGEDPLEVGAVKLDNDFAAVLVKKIGSFDPTRLQIFPVALIKRDAKWTAAPVPASFENSGTGYASELRKRIDELERWMLLGQVEALEELRSQSASRMREKIELHLPSKILRQMDLQSFMGVFLEACSNKNLSTMLGCLGGLATTLPEDWPARLKTAEDAVSTKSHTTHPWRLLTSPDVARVIVEHRGDNHNARISIAYLDPAKKEEMAAPQIEIVHFAAVKNDDDFWQVNPPGWLLRPDDFSQHEADEESDAELRDAFPAKWIEKNSPALQSTAENAHTTLIEALRSGHFPAVLALSKLDDNPALARKACIQAAQVSWSVQNPTAARHVVPLAFRATDKAAVGLFQFFSARDPSRFEPTSLYFENSSNGWQWAPEPTQETRESLNQWLTSETKSWRDQWQEILLKDCPILDKAAFLPAPTRDDAENLIKKWLEATRKGDVLAALKLIVRLDDPQGESKVMQNLGYEVNTMRQSAAEPSITAIYRSETWTAVGVKSNPSGKLSLPLYPVIQTPQGPRILIEIDLFSSKNRGREFLNKEAFERLKKYTDTTEELKNLYSKYQASIADNPVMESH